MKEYAYETFYYGRGPVLKAGNKDRWRSIIDRYAKQGYRYAGYIPAEFGPYGMLNAIDLIFEKDV